jgi:hypothetical protein
MRWSEYPSRRLGVLYFACIVLVGAGAVAFATAASNASERVTVGAGPLSDPNRAIPTLASRRPGSVRGPQQVAAPIRTTTIAGAKAKPAATAAPETRDTTSREGAAGKSTSAKPAPTRRPAGRPAKK